ATSMVGLMEDGSPIFRHDSVRMITEWLAIREAVYNRLMLSEADFAGKIMLLYATVRAFETGVLSQEDWKMTDQEFIGELLSSNDPLISDTVRNWLLGHAWQLGPLRWMSGNPPKFSEMAKLSTLLSQHLGCVCFAYRIKDKRKRRLEVHT